jgi:hypothetical protein
MKYGIRIRFSDSSDLLVLREHRPEISFPNVALPSAEASHHLMVFVIIKHWYFCLATPTPHEFHRQ